MLFRASSLRRKQRREEVAERAASKLHDKLMSSSGNRYLTYRVPFWQRQLFTPRGGSGSGTSAITQRAVRFEERVVSSLAVRGIRVESSLDLDIQTKPFNPEKVYLRMCRLTVQRA